MTSRLHLPTPSLAFALVAVLAACLAGCGDSGESRPGLFLNEPTAVAAFRGLTTQSSAFHPYLAVANASGNELTILDAVTDVMVPAPVPLRPLVFPVPDRPTLLASASLNDGDKPDLLVVVAAGDSRLQVVSTWQADGAIAGEVDLGRDVLALASVGSPAVGQARIVAALSGERSTTSASPARIAVVTFSRSIVAGREMEIDVAGATLDFSNALGFLPVALAAAPGDATVVYAATPDPIPIGSTQGVAVIGVSPGTPALTAALNAGAPTRLVAAADLWDASSASTSLDVDAFNVALPRERRVYAVLDESGCGLDAAIACGVVELDPSTGGLTPDPAGELPFRAPLAIPGAALALAAAQPPVVAPTGVPDPSYAGTYVRMVTGEATRWTTATAAVASTDGSLYFVDLGRWELPGEQKVAPTATLVATPDPDASTTAMRVTPGYTPTVRWTATYQGAVPGMTLRRAESGSAGGAPWLALQVASGASEVVNLYDPALGVQPGDVVVIVDPAAVGSCAPTFEAMVSTTVADAFIAPDSDRPGGAVQLDPVPDPVEWGACLASLPGKQGLRATIRAGGWILTRPLGSSTVQVGRPVVGAPFAVEWEDEAALSCPASPVTSCDATCRDACQRLLRARLARRIGYTPSLGNATGPAFGLTLTLTGVEKRGLAVVVDTNEGRVPFRTLQSAVGARMITTFDRSPYAADQGVRFLVPYASGAVLDATPTLSGGSSSLLH